MAQHEHTRVIGVWHARCHLRRNITTALLNKRPCPHATTRHPIVVTSCSSPQSKNTALLSHPTTRSPTFLPSSNKMTLGTRYLLTLLSQCHGIFPISETNTCMHSATLAKISHARTHTHTHTHIISLYMRAYMCALCI
jgi:hypothetical protein